MAEYLIQGETLTELGDKIRVLSGTEDTLTPSQMTSNVQSANDEVDAQSALIDQLSAALDGKAGGSGSGSGVETCTVTIDCSAGGLILYSANILSYGQINCVSENFYDKNNSHIGKVVSIENVVCGSAISVSVSGLVYPAFDLVGAEQICHYSKDFTFKVTASAGTTATLTLYDND